MDTTKILAFRHPSQVELLLESLIASLDCLSARARKVTDRSDLPSSLQKIAIQATKAKLPWRAWIQDDAIRFFSAEQSLDHWRVTRRPALLLNAYDSNGRIRSRTLWAYARDGKWRRCAR